MCALIIVEPGSIDFGHKDTKCHPSGNAASIFGVRHDLSLHSHRLMTRFRKSSFLLYQSHPFCVVISKLEVCVQVHLIGTLSMYIII